MTTEVNTNFTQAVAGVLIEKGKVLLARHTYGPGQGKLIIPGGYVQFNESVTEALKREFMEETGIDVEVGELIGMRFNQKDWYAVFRVHYISGEAQSDHDENSEVLWLDTGVALQQEDVPMLSKQLIDMALQYHGFESDFIGSGILYHPQK